MALPDPDFYGLAGGVATAYNALRTAIETHTHSIRVEDLADVIVVGLSDGDVLTYEAATRSWRVSPRRNVATQQYVADALAGALTHLTVE